MVHLPALISDLGLILAAAGITTLVFKKIKQPVVLGYIVAGLLVGPHVSLLPTVIDIGSINIWGEIGVIFLLFSLGLEFSFKKLVKVGGSASVMAIVEAAVMMTVGFATGMLMGWSTMDSVFLGGLLAISSTTIIIKAFEELGLKSKHFAKLVFGVLIVEDLIAIVLMVLLSTLAVSRQFEGWAMLTSVAELFFFLILWFLGGIFLIPTWLKKAKNLMNDETMLVVSIAFCLLMVILATKVGFSPALGAFVMGSILAETTQAERIEHLVQPVKNLFGAVFFVSVGMLIDPAMIVAHIGPVLIITAVTIVGKIISTGGGALISGQSLKTSIQSGMSVSQIGEFSFIIAGLGLTLGVTSDFLYPVAIAVSAITTLTTPYMIRLSDPLSQRIEGMLPTSWVERLNHYRTGAQLVSVSAEWKSLIKTYIFNIAIYSVIIVAIILFSSMYLRGFVVGSFGEGMAGTIVGTTVSLLLMAPFLWALAVRNIRTRATSDLWKQGSFSHGPIVMMEILRLVLAAILVCFFLAQSFSTWIAIAAIAIVFSLAILILSKKLQSFYDWVEARFISNLNEREQEQGNDLFPSTTPWDADMSHFVVTPELSIVGQTLDELKFRERFGVNIAMLERGSRIITIPGGKEYLYPGDRLTVVGTDEQIASLKDAFDSAVMEQDHVAQPTLKMLKLPVTAGSQLLSKTIRTSGIREKAKTLVIGVERAGERILNPDSSLELLDGDVLLLVGDPALINSMYG